VKPSKGGTKRSSWLTFRRRLILVRALLRAPLSRDNLVSVVQDELGDEGYPSDTASALKNDLDALKGEYGCQIRFHRHMNCYVLEDMGDLALLDLPDDCLEAVAFLDASFPAGSDVSAYAGVRSLLDRIVKLLPRQRQREHAQGRHVLSMQLPGASTHPLDPDVLATVRRAIAQRRELSFHYRSNTDDHLQTQHRVAPYDIYFSAEGHTYLDATMLDVAPRHPAAIIPAAIPYRLDRIVAGTAQVLHTVLPKERIQPQRYTLRYHLVPAVARRRDVSAYFPDTRITYHDDGSATVTATVTNLWQTRQILLRYGSACEVLEPPELIELFCATVDGMAETYRKHMRQVEGT
jgi:predicted DNA-binding transcriptional regulator YafY